MNQTQDDEVGANAQVAGFFVCVSVIVFLMAWVFIPFIGAKDGRLDWASTMNEILSDTIVHSGWAMIAIAVALLAAGLVVLTITGLEGRHAVATLKRDSVRGVVLAFIFTAVALLTVPAWGLLAGMIRIFLLQAPLPDRQIPAMSETAIASALKMGSNSIAIGAVALMVLWCASQLASAVGMWLTPDVNALGEQRLSSLISQMKRQHGALKQLQRKVSYHYLAQMSFARLAGMFAVRQLAIAALTLATMTGLAILVPWEATPGTESITWPEWAILVLFYFIGPNLWMPILGWTMLIYVSMTSTPIEINGVRKLSVGLKSLRILLLVFGGFVSLVFPVLHLMTLEPRSPYVVTLWISGLLPQVLIWWPWKWGRFDILLAKLARIELARQRAATRREIARIQGEGFHDLFEESEEKGVKTSCDPGIRDGKGIESGFSVREQQPRIEPKPEPVIILKFGNAKLEIARSVRRSAPSENAVS